jgi:tRNA G18 (ribose-2'-O)-methylase SpoU
MGLRKMRKRLHDKKKFMAKQYERHRRANLLAKRGPHDFIIVLDHLKPSYNVGKIFRSADAFGAREVHLIDINSFNVGPAMGSFKWVPACFYEDFEGSFQDLDKMEYTLFTLEADGDTPLPAAKLPKRSAFVFGHEEFGISFDKADYPGVQSLSIPQLGKVESLNVSIAASLVMYEYLKQHDERFEGK